MYRYSCILRQGGKDFPTETKFNAPSDLEAKAHADDIEEILGTSDTQIISRKLEEGSVEGSVFVVKRALVYP